MSDREITQRRLYQQHIAFSRWTKPEEVVSGLLAIQAQDYFGSLWAIGLRLKDATEESVEQAVASKLIVRSWPMRGTLHFVAPADVRWLLKLLAPRIIHRAAGTYRQAGVDKGIVAKSRKLFIKALENGGQLTRSEMYAVLEKGKITTQHQRGLHIMGWLAQEGLLCFGPRKGKQHTFVLLDEWIPRSRILTKEESLAELTQRYFTGHGPATVHDFAWWAGLTLAEAKTGMEMAVSRLAKIKWKDKSYWVADTGSVARLRSGAYLLPAYDEYTVGYKDRSMFLDVAHATKAGNGIFNPVMIVDGKIAGTWKRTIQKKKVVIESHSFLKTDPELFQRAATKLSRFLQLPSEFQRQ